MLKITQVTTTKQLFSAKISIASFLKPVAVCTLLMHPSKIDAKLRLITAYKAFVTQVDPLTDEQFSQHVPGKWSVADTLQHLFLSARNIPPLLTGSRSFFGQWPAAGRASKLFDEVAADYDQVLARGIKSPPNFSPRPDDEQLSKTDALTRFITVHQAFANGLMGWTEEEVDHYQLPHPALGLITIRELTYFTAYHIEHHRLLIG